MNASLVLVLLVAVLSASSVASAGQGTTRAPDVPPVEPLPLEIRPVAGNLYQFRNGGQVSVFAVMARGIVVADPLSRGAVLTLEAELARRFPDRPVRYVVHTTHRFERAEGAQRFAKTAEIIVHSGFNEALTRARRALPNSLLGLDRDGNQVLEEFEVANDPRSLELMSRDANGDSRLEPSELYRYVPTVRGSYRGKRLLQLGAESVELVQVPGSDGTPSTAVYFPGARRVFVEGYPDLSNPSTRMTLRSVQAWTDRLAHLDFDIILTATGETHDRDDLLALRHYVSAVFEGARAAYDVGQAADTLLATSFLDSHARLTAYGQRDRHVREAFRSINPVRLQLHMAPGMRRSSPGDTFCEPPFYTTCTQEQSAPSVTTGLALTVRRVVAVVELSLEGQTTVQRGGARVDEMVVHRQAMTSVLVGRARPITRASVTFLGGLSVISTDSAWRTQAKQVLGQIPSPRQSDIRTTRNAFTGGVDASVPLGGAVSLVVPIRFTVGFNEPGPTQPGRMSIRGSAGLRVNLARLRG